ncbi:MAG: autotransporter domain-containing protein [Opitutaceae bacterium]|jgi:autotransporter-associated beta strand protein|nr:autotransporter domain-containing protein [Opitutaceae bacterium]
MKNNISTAIRETRVPSAFAPPAFVPPVFASAGAGAIPLLLLLAGLVLSAGSARLDAQAQLFYDTTGTGFRDPNKVWYGNDSTSGTRLFVPLIWTGTTADLLGPGAWNHYDSEWTGTSIPYNGALTSDAPGAMTLGSYYSGTMPDDFTPGTVLVLPYKTTDGGWAIPDTRDVVLTSLTTADQAAELTAKRLATFRPYGGGGITPHVVEMVHNETGDRTLSVAEIQFTDSYLLDIRGNDAGRFTLELTGLGFTRYHFLAFNATGTPDYQIIGLNTIRPLQVHVGPYATLAYTGTASTDRVSYDLTTIANWGNRNIWLTLSDSTSCLDLSALAREQENAFVTQEQNYFSRITAVAGSSIIIPNGGALELGMDNSTSVIDGIISSGSGTKTHNYYGVRKMGLGALYLNGVNTYRGRTSLTAGEIYVNGVVPEDLIAEGSSYVGGSGTITTQLSMRASTFLSAGAKGGTVGELTVKGDFEQTTQTTWMIADLATNAAGEVINDKLKVSGTATLQGGLTVRVAPGMSLFSGTYTIIEANELSGQFYRVEMPGFVSLKGGVHYDRSQGESRVDVSFRQIKFSEIEGLSDLARSTARLLDKSVDRVESDTAWEMEWAMVGKLNSILGLRAMEHALVSLLPAADRYWFPTAVASTSDIEKRLEERVPQPLGPEVSSRLAVFAGASFMDSDVSAEEGAEAVGVNTIRFTGGVDFRMSPSLTLSGFYSNEVSKADTDATGGKGEIKSHSFGVHADWRPGNWRVQGTVLIGADDYISNRSLRLTKLGDLADDKTSGDRSGLSLTVSRAIDFFGGTLWPYAGMQCVFWEVDAYDEHGTALPVHVDKQSARSYIGKAGLHFNHQYIIKSLGMTGRVFVNLGLQTELGDTERKMTGVFNYTPWSLEFKGKKTGFNLRAGMEFDLSRHFSVSFSGGRENGLHDYDNLSFWGGLSCRF